MKSQNGLGAGGSYGMPPSRCYRGLGGNLGQSAGGWAWRAEYSRGRESLQDGNTIGVDMCQESC